MPLDLNYHHLYYFWSCVRAGSLTAAAQELNLSQSALSLQLKSLERSVGRRLLERSRSGVTPTAEGRVVFERCERIFPEGEKLAAVLRAGHASTPVYFRLGVASGLGREVVLNALDRVADERLIETVFVGPGSDVQVRLQRHQVDVALFAGDPSSALGAGYRIKKLGSETLRFVAAPELAKRLGKFPRRGVEYPFLMRPQGHPVRVRAETWLRENGLSFSTIAETADADVLHALALRGRAIGVLRESVVREDLAARRLARLAGSPTDLTLDLWGACPVRPAAEPETGRAVELVMTSNPLAYRAAKA